MFTTIIWATDGSRGADEALRAALELAQLGGGRVVAVHCDQRLTGRAGGWPAILDEDDRRVGIRDEIADLRRDGVMIDLIMRRSHREAADVVASIADELDADVIVCGTRGLGALGGLLVGSFTQRLLHIAPCPVLAVPVADAEETSELPVRARDGAAA